MEPFKVKTQHLQREQKETKQLYPEGWLVIKEKKHSALLPLAASGSRTFLWISVVSYTCGKSTALFHQVPPGQ